MPAHETRLVAVEPLCAGTSAFHFSRPPGFAFKAGQAVDLVLPGSEMLKHTFSLVNAPGEERLTIATRLRGSPYKQALAALVPGMAATIDGPFGSLTLHRDAARPALLVAGGIGVTPFVSMLREFAGGAPLRDFTLLYSNRRPGDAAFLGELASLERRTSGFRLVATMTAADTGWAGPTGRIGEPLLREALGRGGRPVCYVAGSPAFVQGLRDALSRAGVDEDDIRSEEFFGY